MRIFTQDFSDAIFTIIYHLDINFPPDEAKARQAVALGEEVGEALGAMRRCLGWARRDGGMNDVEKELADVIITTAVTMGVWDIDLNEPISSKLQEILTRGWKEPRTRVDNHPTILLH